MNKDQELHVEQIKLDYVFTNTRKVEKAIPLTSSEVVAEKCGIQHKNIRQHIRKNEETLKKLGELKLIKSGKNGTKNYHVYYELNKDQLAFLLSKLKRSDNRNALAKEFGIDFQIVGNRLENNFKQILNAIIKGFSNELILESQINFNKYRADYVIYQLINNKKYISLIIEYDEEIHKYKKEEDLKREKDIANYIFKNNLSDEVVFFYRVKENNELKAITDIITFLNNDPSLDVKDYKNNTNIKSYYINNMDEN